MNRTLSDDTILSALDDLSLVSQFLITTVVTMEDAFDALPEELKHCLMSSDTVIQVLRSRLGFEDAHNPGSLPLTPDN